jgi:hypothetical protein
MAIPPQTPDYQRRAKKQFMRQERITTAVFVVGTLLIVAGGEERTVLPRVVWIGLVVLGVVLLVLNVLLLPVRWGRAAKAAYRKDLALREPGTVELLTVASSPNINDGEEFWKLTSDMQIRLDSGPTFNGSYYAIRGSGPGGHRAEVRPFDGWFRVGASLRCLVNPTNSDSVWVFPFAAPGAALLPPSLTKGVLYFHDGTTNWREIVRFWSAT